MNGLFGRPTVLVTRSSGAHVDAPPPEQEATQVCASSINPRLAIVREYNEVNEHNMGGEDVFDVLMSP